MNSNKIKDENLNKIMGVKQLIDETENILIGAGARLSTSAGKTYIKILFSIA